MSNSSLVSYVNISPNKNTMSGKVNKMIAIHCMAGNMTVESCGQWMAKTSTQASSNYGVGSDGRIGMYVEEKDRSWCTSSSYVDGNGISIEVANDGGAPDWHVSDAALSSLINLCADICKRNGFRLNYTGDKSGNMQMHRWYKNKACPGDYLASLFPYIQDEVNKILDGGAASAMPVTTPSSTNIYRIRKSWGDTGSQIGAYSILNNAINACPEGYNVYDPSGNVVHSNGGDSQASSNFANVYYSVKANGRTYSEIKNYNNTDGNGYAGVENKAISDVTAMVDKGQISYRVHTKGGRWLPWVNGYNWGDHNNGYAGNGRPIDGIQFKSTGTGGRIWYRASTTTSNSYLPWVVEDTDYAGIYGKTIDKLQVVIDD